VRSRDLANRTGLDIFGDAGECAVTRQTLFKYAPPGMPVRAAAARRAGRLGGGQTANIRAERDKPKD
jgi:hypothetical protein